MSISQKQENDKYLFYSKKDKKLQTEIISTLNGLPLNQSAMNYTENQWMICATMKASLPETFPKLASIDNNPVASTKSADKIYFSYITPLLLTMADQPKILEYNPEQKLTKENIKTAVRDLTDQISKTISEISQKKKNNQNNFHKDINVSEFPLPNTKDEIVIQPYFDVMIAQIKNTTSVCVTPHLQERVKSNPTAHYVREQDIDVFNADFSKEYIKHIENFATIKISHNQICVFNITGKQIYTNKELVK